MPVKLMTAGGGGVNLTPDSSIASDVTVNVPSVNGTVLIPGQASALTAGTAKASTSGTSIDFTGIPSWVKRVTVTLFGVSLSGGARVLVQVGTSSGTVTSGYNSYTNDAGATSTAGFILGGATNTDNRYGQIVITMHDTNKWVSTGITNSSTSSSYMNIGNVTLAATLDRVRITTTNGTDTFDAGSINILWE